MHVLCVCVYVSLSLPLSLCVYVCRVYVCMRARNCLSGVRALFAFTLKMRVFVRGCTSSADSSATLPFETAVQSARDRGKHARAQPHPPSRRSIDDIHVVANVAGTRLIPGTTWCGVFEQRRVAIESVLWGHRPGLSPCQRTPLSPCQRTPPPCIKQQHRG